jgi:hypothetical protein
MRLKHSKLTAIRAERPCEHFVAGTKAELVDPYCGQERAFRETEGIGEIPSGNIACTAGSKSYQTTATLREMLSLPATCLPFSTTRRKCKNAFDRTRLAPHYRQIQPVRSQLFGGHRCYSLMARDPSFRKAMDRKPFLQPVHKAGMNGFVLHRRRTHGAISSYIMKRG